MNTSNRFKAAIRVVSMLSLTVVVLLAGCNKEDDLPTAQDLLNQVLANVDQAQLTADLAIIDDSLTTWGLIDQIQEGPQGVRYLVEEMGSGPKPVLESTIPMNYTGKLLSTGGTFDSGQNVNFQLYRLIAGFQTVLPLLPAGTTVTLYIPSGLGYGAQDATDNAGNIIIPANSNLIFEIEML